MTRLLTILTILFCCTSCAFVKEISLPSFSLTSSCKSRSYLESSLEEYLAINNIPLAKQRLAIATLAIPENFYLLNTKEDLGVRLTTALHQELLKDRPLQIIEVLPRIDWPFKKEEFAGGNFNGINLSHQGGYRFLIVGKVEDPTRANELSVALKIIDVLSGVTVSYSVTTLTLKDGIGFSWLPRVLSGSNSPPSIYDAEIEEKLVSCVANRVFSDEGGENYYLPNEQSPFDPLTFF